MKKYNNFNIEVISKPDNNIFFSNEHSLGDDFLNLFDLFYSQIKFEKNNIFNLPKEIIYNTKDLSLKIDYSNIYPQIILFK